jgi:hypothetical protein
LYQYTRVNTVIWRHTPTLKSCGAHVTTRSTCPYVASVPVERCIKLTFAYRIKKASQWFARLEQKHIQDSLPPRPAKPQRIKIAVLDTGIDLNNDWISQKRGRVQCWPTNGACADQDGHGTQVAYLILLLAPHVQVHVAKVSQSGLLQDANITAIAEAIKHFSSDNSNKVDVINLSFGFPSFDSRLQPIRSAIDTARQNKVLVFAASGNDGGNQPCAWPAKLHEVDKVISISASDSDGNASGFNPTSSPDRICTLGEAVPSCVADVSRSGTSFSTPIAAAIAAIVLGFVDNAANYEDDAGTLALPSDFETLKLRLRTRLGMEKVLCETCVEQGTKRRAGFAYITPWYFLGMDARSRIGIITNVLRNVPEA